MDHSIWQAKVFHAQWQVDLALQTVTQDKDGSAYAHLTVANRLLKAILEEHKIGPEY